MPPGPAPGSRADGAHEEEPLKARVYVMLKKSVFDPQGRTIQDALGTLGYRNVSDVRQGKYFELSLEGLPAAEAKEAAEEIARRVLANPVIESYRVEVEP
jgi:phosphoribosylformylglycinamidine synthase PurS subunit